MPPPNVDFVDLWTLLPPFSLLLRKKSMKASSAPLIKCISADSYLHYYENINLYDLIIIRLLPSFFIHLLHWSDHFLIAGKRIVSIILLNSLALLPQFNVFTITSPSIYLLYTPVTSVSVWYYPVVDFQCSFRCICLPSLKFTKNSFPLVVFWYSSVFLFSFLFPVDL